MGKRICKAFAGRASRAFQETQRASTAWAQAKSRWKRVELMAHPSSREVAKARTAYESAKRRLELSISRFNDTSRDYTRCVDRKS